MPPERPAPRRDRAGPGEGAGRVPSGVRRRRPPPLLLLPTESSASPSAETRDVGGRRERGTSPRPAVTAHGRSPPRRPASCARAERGGGGDGGSRHRRAAEPRAQRPPPPRVTGRRHTHPPPPRPLRGAGNRRGLRRGVAVRRPGTGPGPAFPGAAAEERCRPARRCGGSGGRSRGAAGSLRGGRCCWSAALRSAARGSRRSPSCGLRRVLFEERMGTFAPVQSCLLSCLLQKKTPKTLVPETSPPPPSCGRTSCRDPRVSRLRTLFRDNSKRRSAARGVPVSPSTGCPSSAGATFFPQEISTC